MAKKKVSNAQHEKPSQKQVEESVKSPPMDSPPPSVDSEKLESLKSLNQMLLKEAVERRQQVDSLVQAKGGLEMELARSNSEKAALGSDLARLVERAAELEVERNVVAVFVAVQVGEKGKEFNRKMEGLEMEMREREREIVRVNGELSESRGELKVVREDSRRARVERDVFEAKMNREIDVGAGLRANLSELGDKMREMEREIEESRTAYDAVVKEREGEIVRLNGELSESRGELKVEREASRRVRVERDVFEAKLKQETDVGAGLRANLSELGDKMREMEREIEESRAAYNAVVREREDMEMRIKLLMGEKDASEKGLIESNKLVEKMKEEISVIVREKEGVVKEKNDEIVKRRELETAVSTLDEMVTNLQKEEAKLQKIVAELDRNRVEGEEKLSEMGMEMSRLVGEMKLSEKRIEGLVDEKSVTEKDLNEALKNLAEKKLELEGLANEKVVILEEKDRLEGEVGVLGNNVDELKAAVSELKESNVGFADTIKSLESQVGDYKCKLEKVYAERDGAERSLDEQKQYALKLKSKIQELEKGIEESHKASGDVKAEKAAILSEKVELESRCGKLREEIASLQEAMVKLRAEFDSMKSKAEMADANSELVLNMLKGTSAFCSKEECNGEVESMLVDSEVVKVHAMEMETIKKAFKSKAAKVEDMKRQLEALQSCVVDEQKKKSFWTMLSSASTFLAAAVSIAYVARGH